MALALWESGLEDGEGEEGTDDEDDTGKWIGDKKTDADRSKAAFPAIGSLWRHNGLPVPPKIMLVC